MRRLELRSTSAGKVGRPRALRCAAAFGAAGVVVLAGSTAAQSKSRHHATVRPALAYFGGGKINASNEGHNPNNDWVLLAPSHNRRQIHLAVQVVQRCSNGGGEVTPVIQATGTLHENGGFSGRSGFSSSGSSGQVTTTLSFSGRFVTSTRALATVSLRTSTSSGACDTGKLKVEADAPAPHKRAGALARNASYFGTNDSGPFAQKSQSVSCTGPSCLFTGQGYAPAPVTRWPMMLQTAADGKSVRLFSYIYTTQKCQVASTELSANELGPPPAPIAKNGSFVENDKFDEGVGGGYVAHVTATVHGRFTDKIVRGTLRVDNTIADSSGTVVDHCSTGTVLWAAVRG